MTSPVVKSADADRTPVAQDVYTYCTREKTDTWHVVMNHNAQGIVDRVKCKACGSEHRYRRNDMGSLPRASGAAVVRRSNGMSLKVDKPVEKSSAVLENTWMEGLKKWGDKAVRDFDPAVSFAVGEVVNHLSFGKGVVQARRENRVDVLFRSGIGMKTLPSRP